jgi:hypothetical protein
MILHTSSRTLTVSDPRAGAVNPISYAYIC